MMIDLLIWRKNLQKTIQSLPVLLEPYNDKKYCMKILSVLVIAMVSMESCSQKPKIEITTEYIFNELWSKPVGNSFKIEKMNIKKDSLLNVLAPRFKPTANSLNVVRKLETDSSFVYKYISLFSCPESHSRALCAVDSGQFEVSLLSFEGKDSGQLSFFIYNGRPTQIMFASPRVPPRTSLSTETLGGNEMVE